MTPNGARRVIVVGAGISGLAAAFRVLEQDPSIELEILEGSARPGGWLRTEERDGFVIELGPDSILTEKPHALALVRRLGIEDRVVSTNTAKRGAYVVSGGRLVRIPEGFSMMAPVDPFAFLASEVVSSGAKVRAGLEVVVPPRRAPEGEESLARFVRRRFGAEMLERLAQPMISGIYGSDAEVLSLEATMPRFTRMERERGSVTRALRAAASSAKKSDAASGARYGLFIGFDRGMQVMIDALVRAIGPRLRTNTPVRAIERGGQGWRVVLESGETRSCDAVVLAVASHRIASMLRGVDGVLADGLEAIPHGSAATVTFAWRESEVPHALDAFGFVVPAVERRSILASTWASTKWPDRAPAGWALIRVFVGGLHDPDAADRDDDALVRSARRELRALMGIEASPAFTKVMRYPRAMPLYQVGHLARVEAIEARASRHDRLGLAGNGMRGVGIPDAIASGERAADRVLASVRGA
ncbi:protoporphyrinogen oxidase [Sandaracinus amylolyticus]|uniref:Protoporphyrinogen IX oxidase, aerobic, HemY n=1 Tax=Sandaracinus amylolyticus TaxID=927083 RepID=A0A0F6W2F5_9BACT|nr:protoporphyrinogen oxidase [Sandaracinus amylolyticus]AKF05781.1 Protoporphyrinogen IX oxidase, aerobic, HemY [Sandaracinus amylolyticus]